MKLFCRLYHELDSTTRTTDKVRALERYFREAPPADAAWALSFLIGRRLPRGVTTTQLRQYAADFAGIPIWMVEECYEAVGDLAETLALLLPEPAEKESLPLHVLVEERLLPLPRLNEEERRAILETTWRQLSGPERFLWHKLLTGGFRVGAGRTLTARALAAVAGVDPAVMSHRLMGPWQPTAADYQRLLSGDAVEGDVGKPFPFLLAYPIEVSIETLGDVRDWQIEWKWDGIRAQIICRDGKVLTWSRGEELITDQFPELKQAALALPNSVVLDGEILIWGQNSPRPFSDLQKRLNRKRVTSRDLKDYPAVFVAYDLLELNGEDCRTLPLYMRRERLERFLDGWQVPGTLRLSPLLPLETWAEVAVHHALARECGAEGLMLKLRSSPYVGGRVKGVWWKWKVEPFHVDAVLINAQAGHGRRAGLYTDYTFAVWHEGRLVPIAKAYSGLTDEEIREVDAFVKANTVDRFGPVRAVRPELVFELAFEGIQRSSRHKSGIALRFPRMNRWRKDKRPEEADHLERLWALLPSETDSR
ncbi:MAG: ATP-dependent DNA ligase [Gemmatales bacterium]|nr:ATP-dependent DNA ligase [Gemmatales bacterium]MDW8386876.1 ATP-dependent DNA ligase [Gemmatales bacterium]